MGIPEMASTDRLRALGFEPNNVLAYRAYAPEGQRFPRMVIAVWPEFPLIKRSSHRTGFMVRASVKHSQRHWWETTPIPYHLIDDVIELLQEAKEKTP